MNYYMQATGADRAKHRGRLHRSRIVTPCGISFPTRSAVSIKPGDDDPPADQCQWCATGQLQPLADPTSGHLARRIRAWLEDYGPTGVIVLTATLAVGCVLLGVMWLVAVAAVSAWWAYSPVDDASHLLPPDDVPERPASLTTRCGAALPAVATVRERPLGAPCRPCQSGGVR